MLKVQRVLAATAAAALAITSANSAFAACTRLAFTVNDYGKDGPTRDAKNLLDKYIAKWASDRKITGYNTGTKEVTCELFLDVILFDEYTCKAAATVCWNGPLPPGHTTDASAQPPVVNKAAQTKAAAPAPIATGSVKAAPPAAPKAAAPAPAPAAAKAQAVPAAAPVAPAVSPAPAAAPAAN
jgi:hypothetical protein